MRAAASNQLGISTSPPPKRPERHEPRPLSGGADAAGSVWTVGPWRVHAGTGELVRGDESLRVEPRVAEVLVYL
ncbi:MAG TPA: hypothetical protein PKU97_10720, partial [Kofleriaceae bacterium]|nr:hypothetical protein [Kofleriaceae bacterium]